jgi:hypothetical protein
MKIDSEYLDIDINPEFKTQSGTLRKGFINVEFWDDRDVYFEENDNVLWMTINELQEIVRVGKMFLDRRIRYLASIK